MRFAVLLEGVEYPVEVSDGLQVALGDRVYKTRVKVAGPVLKVSVGRRTYEFKLQGRTLALRGEPLDVRFEGYRHHPTAVPEEPRTAAPLAGGVVRAPMPGRVVAVTVGRGDTVTLGNPLLILEAMKMQNEIPSPFEGVVREIKVAAGAIVGKEDVLMVIE
ncbi:MAG: biotin/lipoyl-containing protein [Thermoplasmata archaeon]